LNALQSGSPKQPAAAWFGQKLPLASDICALPVVSGDKSIPSAARNCAHVPPPHWALVVHVWPLFVPPKHLFVPRTDAGCGQSRESPSEFVLVQA
jgi:hypothetical protein